MYVFGTPPQPWFQSWLGHVRKLPVTWGQVWISPFSFDGQFMLLGALPLLSSGKLPLTWGLGSAFCDDKSIPTFLLFRPYSSV